MRLSLLRVAGVVSVGLSVPLLNACGEGGSTATSTPGETPAPVAIESLGLMELSVNSASGEASAKMLSDSSGLPASVLFNDDAAQGLDLQQVTHSSHDIGSPGNGGYRYISVTYQVRNAQYCATPGSCTPYPDASDNLVFVAARVSGNLAGTAVRGIKKQNGTSDTAV